MNSSEQSKKDLEEVFNAMESSEKQEAYRREQNKTFSGKMDMGKAAVFAEYLNKIFIDTCNDKTIAGRFIKWEIQTAEYKIKIAQDIVNIFMQKIKNDILNGAVPIYTRSGEVYKKTNELVDANFKEDIVSGIRDVKVSSDVQLNSVMATSFTGDISIQTAHPFYTVALLFLMDLRHELTHVIDTIVPAISPLDPDIRTNAAMYYEWRDNDLYENNPWELLANTKRKECREQIQAMLDSQEQSLSNNVQHIEGR